jgi:type IV secretory pathway VirB10-like protein
MQMNALFAAGLIDNQWLFAIIVIVGAVANWLSKRRQEKQAEQHPPESEETSPPSGKPAGEFNLEEALRRLMGEEPSLPVPRPIPHAPPSELPSAPDWEEEESYQTARQTTPPLRPPRIAVAQAIIATTAASEQQEQAARRFEQLNEQARHPATVVSHVRAYRLHAGKRAASPWRNPRSARQAFVASLVFAPPKSLEP